jgi:hypothetical protein
MRNAKKSEIDITKLKALDNSITVTVGTGGNFSTITQAINYLMEYRPTKVGVKVTIQLMAGFVMKEQVLLRNGDYSWIQIDSVDTEVVIDRTYIQTAMASDVTSSISAFYFIDRCIAPRINVLFSMNTLGASAGQGGCLLMQNSNGIILPNKGFKDCPGTNAAVIVNSTLLARNCVFTSFVSPSGSGVSISASSSADVSGSNMSHNSVGLDVQTGSSANAENITSSGNTNYGILAASNSTVNAPNASLLYNGAYGIIANYASRVNAHGSTTANSGTFGFIVTTGATINASSSTGTKNIAVNTVTANGIIFA